MVKEVNKEHKNVKMTRKKKRSGIVYFDYSLLAILICLVCFGWLCYIVQVLIAQ